MFSTQPIPMAPAPIWQEMLNGKGVLKISYSGKVALTICSQSSAKLLLPE